MDKEENEQGNGQSWNPKWEIEIRLLIKNLDFYFERFVRKTETDVIFNVALITFRNEKMKREIKKIKNKSDSKATNNFTKLFTFCRLDSSENISLFVLAASDVTRQLK